MIASAVQRGSYVYVYNERGGQLCALPCGNDGSLQGYTASTVSIKRGNYIYIYDEKGSQKSAIPAR